MFTRNIFTIAREIIAILFGDASDTLAGTVFPPIRAYTAMVMNNYIPAWTYGFFVVIQMRINRLYPRRVEASRASRMIEIYVIHIFR
jgi:hypothetical protein